MRVPILLTNSQCSRCKSIARYLKSNDIKIEIDQVSKYLKEIRELKLRRLPIFKLGEEFIQYTTPEETLQKVIQYAKLESEG